MRAQASRLRAKRSRAHGHQVVFFCMAEVGNKKPAAEWGSKGAVNAATHSARKKNLRFVERWYSDKSPTSSGRSWLLIKICLAQPADNQPVWQTQLIVMTHRVSLPSAARCSSVWSPRWSSIARGNLEGTMEEGSRAQGV